MGKVISRFLPLVFCAVFLIGASADFTFAQEDWQNELLLGQEASTKGDTKTARKHFEKAIDLNPDPVFKAETNAAIATTYLVEKDYKKAAKYLDRSIEDLEGLDPPSSLLPQIYVLRAVVALGQGDQAAFLTYSALAKGAKEAQAPADGTVWQPGSTEDAVVHIKTGTEFPFQVGAFTRAQNIAIRPDGSDVSAMYLIGENGSDAVFSIYFTQGQNIGLLELVNATKQGVGIRYGGVMDPLSEKFIGSVSGEGAVSGAGYRGIFRTNAEGGAEGYINTEIWLVQHHDWNIKFRLTYRPEKRAEVEKSVGKVIDAIRFPEKSSFLTLFGQEFLGLSSCENAVERIAGNGIAIETDNFMRMGISLDATAKAIPKDGDAPAKCLLGVQDATNGYKLALYLPEHVDKEARFMEAAIYEVELLDADWASSRLFGVFRSGILEEGLEQQGSDLEGPFYYLGQFSGNGFLAYAIFQGRPSLSAVLSSVNQVFSGESKPIVSAQVDGEGNMKTNIVPVPDEDGSD